MSDDFDEVMENSVQDLDQLVVGKKIVSAVEREYVDTSWGFERKAHGLVVTLDDGTEFAIQETDDCCAYTDIDRFLLHPENVDHVITSVQVSDNYNTWRILADGRDVLEMDVSWSEGSGYYMYGFEFHTIRVKENA